MAEFKRAHLHTFSNPKQMYQFSS